MGTAELLRSLREQTNSIHSVHREFWTTPTFPSGVAKGIISELMGNARTEWLISFFKQYPEQLILWCEHETRINPTAIFQRGLNLERIKFVKVTDNIHQIIRLALESQLYPFIVAPTTFDDITMFHRLHLLAEKSKSNLFLLGDKKFQPAWPISLQLEINYVDDEFSIQAQRQKYGLTP